MWRDRQGWTPELEQSDRREDSTPLVPFILKLAGEDRGLVYEQPFSNAVSGDLIVAILQGQIRKPPDVSGMAGPAYAGKASDARRTAIMR